MLRIRRTWRFTRRFKNQKDECVQNYAKYVLFFPLYILLLNYLRANHDLVNITNLHITFSLNLTQFLSIMPLLYFYIHLKNVPDHLYRIVRHSQICKIRDMT